MKHLTFTVGGWFDNLPTRDKRNLLRDLGEDYELREWDIRLAGQHWR